jgi:hypothetical protein
MSSRTGPTQGGYGSAYSHLQGQDSGAMRYRGEGGGMGQQPLRRVGALNGSGIYRDVEDYVIRHRTRIHRVDALT